MNVHFGNRNFGFQQTVRRIPPEDHWIHQNVKCKGPCTRFSQTPAKPNMCGCGREKEDHQEQAIHNEADSTEPWNSKIDCDDVGTTAYGKIKFLKEDTDQTPDFIRISDTMSETPEGLNTVMELMTKEELWGMDEHREPNLLISVTGGAKDFEVKPELKTNFAKGLCAAAKSANAWIITGGTDTGVMKIVGDAVYNHSGEITTIGIATWGIIKGKEKLCRTGHQKSRLPGATFDYDGVTENARSTASINPHHTHFIFVDNGTDRKFGAEMGFRAKLERKIAETYPMDKSGTQTQIPIIQVILNGGPNSAKTCLLSMKEDIPLLVIKGSKNCADVIATAHNVSVYNSGRRELTDTGKALVEEEIDRFFKDAKQSVKEEILAYVIEILKMDHLLTIYTLDSKALDHALLFALIKSKTDNNSAIEQMSMAIKWNRPNLANEILSLETVQFNRSQMEGCLKQAILSDRKDFINIFLDEGIEMKQFLTYAQLEEMYQYKPEGSTHLGKKRFFKVVDRLLPHVNSRHDLKLVNIGQLLVKILEGGFKNPLKHINFQKPVDNVYDMLLIYSAINDCKEMADAMWDPCNSPISTALIAYRIYKFHAEFTTGLTAYDHESREGALEEADKYEEYACQSLSKCSKLFDKDDTFLLLKTPHSFWGGHSLVSIAMTVGSDKFLAHGSVQNYLTEVWMGELKSSQSLIGILICSTLIFPFPLLLKYDERTRTPEEIQEFLTLEKHIADARMQNMEMVEKGAKSTTKKNASRDSLENKRKYNLLWYQKIYACFSAPLVKFQWNLVLFLAFVGLYAYTLVIDHSGNCTISSKSSITKTELILLIFVIGTIPTEILQLIQNSANKPLQKISNHFANFFNCVDGLAIFTYFISFMIRAMEPPEDMQSDGVNRTGCEYELAKLPVFADEMFTWYNVGHILNVSSFMFYAMRTMDFLKLSSEMGPKVIMIFAMVKDLVFFIILLLLFVFVYTIGAQAILRPNKEEMPNNGDYLFDLILYRPYLMAMGEFGIEEFVEDFKLDHCCSDGDSSCNAMLGNITCDDDDFALSTLLEFNSIAKTHYYVFVLITVIYILLANILLVNLLIAIFSNTYERVQDNSQVLYLVQRAEMIVEFDCRSILPNPLSLPEHCYMFLKFLYKLCIRKKRKSRRPPVDPSFHKMTKIERACCDEYLAHKEEEDEGYVRDTLKELKDSLKHVQNILDNTSKSNLGAGERSKPRPDLNEALCSVNDDGKKTIKAALSAALAMTEKHEQKVAIGAPIEIHIDSRTTPYPGTDLQRTLVCDDRVPWTVPWPEYKPTEYIKPRPENHPQHHDDVALPKDLIQCFNKNSDGIDRTSFLGTFRIEELTGRPINPRGRTGLSGKGKLKRWGPNHQGDVIVTRWQHDTNGAPVKGPDGRRVLEFVATRKHGQWAIPGGRIIEGEKLVDTLEREFSEEALGSLEMSAEKRRKCMDMVDQHFGLGINVYRGYVDDPRNTDNAWFETTSLNYHDSDGSSFANFPLDGGADEDKESKRAKWITLDTNIDLYANHEWIMEKVCFHRNAHCPITREGGIDGKFKLGAKTSSRWAFFINPVDVSQEKPKDVTNDDEISSTHLAIPKESTTIKDEPKAE